MTIPGSANPLLLASTASAQYTISRSLRFNAPDSAYLSRTPASAGNRKTWTWAGWVKRAKIGTDYEMFFSARAGTSSSRDYFAFQNDLLALTCYNSAGTTITTNIQSTAVFRDPGAWFHVVLAVDTTQSTAANRIRIYVNGAEITAFSLASYPSQNTDLSYNDTQPHTIGQGAAGTAFGFNGYLADVFFVDGQQLTPSSFTEVSATTGQLIPKKYTGTFGTNGFWLQFADNSSNTATTLGKDTSGNGNNFTPTNFSVTAGAGNDSLVDTPTSFGSDTGVGGEVRGNYCINNPLDTGSGITLANGTLDLSIPASSSVWWQSRGSIGVTSGKWYWEVTVTTNQYIIIGVAKSNVSLNTFPGNTADGWGWAAYAATKYNNASGLSYGSATTSGDVVGVAYDADNSTLTFYKNGVSQGSAYTNVTTTSGPIFPSTAINSLAASSCVVNYGQRPFAYTAPSGFKALVDTNLPAPVVAKASSAFDVALWTGNGGTQTVSYANSSFSPDFIWFKSRSIAMNNHVVDVVRGTDANGYLVMQTDATFGESVFDTSWHNTYGKLTSISNNSFTVVSGTSNGGFNTNNVTYAGWAWDAGTTTSSNVAGSITSSVRASASSGFSVVTWTGTGGAGTVGHGLGVVPTFLIVKNRSRADDWLVYSSTQGANKFLQLNTTNAVQTATQPWNNTSPTSTVFSVFADTGTWTNKSGDNYVAYCFAPVAGYSSFGSYVGNGSSDGVFVWTGHRSRWIMIKQSSASGEAWLIHDTARDTYNVSNKLLFPNLANAETTAAGGTGYDIDILSNGFKIRNSNPAWNANGATYIYASFAESPFAYSRAR